MKKKAMNQVVEIFMQPPASAPPLEQGEQPAQVAQVVELADLAPAPPQAGTPVMQTANPLHQVKATLQVCVGVATLTVGELMAAREQQVLLLDRGVHQPVDLLLEGQVVARGQLVAVDDQFALRITELPLPLHLGDSAAP